MEVVFDEYLKFPLPPHMEEDFTALHKACGSIEHIEEAFDIEFSCGDDLYLSDIENDDALVDRYDGEVCTNSAPRQRENGNKFKVDKPYRFTIKYSEPREELMFFLNSKKTFSKWVG